MSGDSFLNTLGRGVRHLLGHKTCPKCAGKPFMRVTDVEREPKTTFTKLENSIYYERGRPKKEQVPYVTGVERRTHECQSCGHRQTFSSTYTEKA